MTRLLRLVVNNKAAKVSGLELHGYVKEREAEIQEDERAELRKEGWDAIWTLIGFMAAIRVMLMIWKGTSE